MEHTVQICACIKNQNYKNKWNLRFLTLLQLYSYYSMIQKPKDWMQFMKWSANTIEKYAT